MAGVLVVIATATLMEPDAQGCHFLTGATAVLTERDGTGKRRDFFGFLLRPTKWQTSSYPVRLLLHLSQIAILSAAGIGLPNKVPDR